MHSLLSQHKDIYMPAIKEPYMYYKKGFDWYMARFYDKTTDKRFVGECNPTLSMAVSHRTAESIASSIRRDFGEVKLIFIMRNPVEKLYSWYRSALQYGWIWERPRDNLVADLSAGFDEYVSSQFAWEPPTAPVWAPGPSPRTSYAPEGLYCKFIRPFTDLWPAEKLKLVLFEDFARDPGAVFNEILAFIGAEPDGNVSTDIVRNASDRAPRSAASIVAMKGVKTLQNIYYNRVPFISYSFCLHATHCLARLESACVRYGSVCVPPMSVRTQELLERYYNDDVRALEKLLNRDLSAVWFADTSVTSLP